jgi:hypothetical protein
MGQYLLESPYSQYDTLTSILAKSQTHLTVRDHRVPPSAMLCLPEIAFVSIQMYFSLDRARRFSL